MDASTSRQDHTRSARTCQKLFISASFFSCLWRTCIVISKADKQRHFLWSAVIARRVSVWVRVRLTSSDSLLAVFLAMNTSTYRRNRLGIDTYLPGNSSSWRGLYEGCLLWLSNQISIAPRCLSLTRRQLLFSFCLPPDLSFFLSFPFVFWRYTNYAER